MPAITTMSAAYSSLYEFTKRLLTRKKNGDAYSAAVHFVLLQLGFRIDQASSPSSMHRQNP